MEKLSFIKRLKAAAKIIRKGVREINDFDTLAQWLGIDVDNTPRKALSNATYYACLKTLSESVGKLPLKILRHTEKQGVRELYNHPLWSVLHDRPNPYMNASCFWSLIEYNRNHYGNGYAWIVYNKSKKETELYPLEPNCVDIWYDDAKILADNPMLWYRYTASNGECIMIPFDCILHVRNFATKDGLKGQSVREVLAETINGNVKAQSLLNKMYDNGFAGKAAIQYTGDMNDELEKRFVKGIEKYIKGEYKAEGIDMLIPLPYMAKIENLSNVKLADAQFLELKQYSAIQIAAAFGIKPVQIGDYTKASYSATEAQQLAFLVETLLFILKQYEEEINYKLLDGTCYAKFNTDAMLRMDFKTKVETLAKAIFSGQLSINEARAKDDRQAVPGGDEIILNGSTIFLKDVGIQYQSSSNTSSSERG